MLEPDGKSVMGPGAHTRASSWVAAFRHGREWRQSTSDPAQELCFSSPQAARMEQEREQDQVDLHPKYMTII